MTGQIITIILKYNHVLQSDLAISIFDIYTERLNRLQKCYSVTKNSDRITL
jgi:hypothetical protein